MEGEQEEERSEVMLKKRMYPLVVYSDLELSISSVREGVEEGNGESEVEDGSRH